MTVVKLKKSHFYRVYSIENVHVSSSCFNCLWDLVYVDFGLMKKISVFDAQNFK